MSAKTDSTEDLIKELLQVGTSADPFRAADACRRAAERLRELDQDNEHLHLANQGIHHYRMCGPDNECCRCRAEQAEAERDELRRLILGSRTVTDLAVLRALAKGGDDR